jgi:flagellar protein FlbD
VIILTRLGCGLQIALNPDLIERAEHTPDTVITLVDGHKLVVEEPLDEIVALIRAWRASIAAEAIALVRMPVSDAEAETAEMADQRTHSPPFGQVLHMPAREV